MRLKFPSSWRFQPPVSEHLHTDKIPEQAVYEFLGMIRRTATQIGTQDGFEHFKRFFYAANGAAYGRSSSRGWAEADLQSAMLAAAENAPLFIEAFFDACEALRRESPDVFVPDIYIMNQLMNKHEIGYEVAPPDLRLVDHGSVIIPVTERPVTIAQTAMELLEKSLKNAEDFLTQGRGREAVQETLWILETVTTAFRGMDTGTGTIEGNYFNRIVKELRRFHSGTTVDRILEWAEALHGYLSSPTGGGVRHGLDIKKGLVLSPNEARLFCNLIRSYLSFLLSEYERLSGQAKS